ncbi:uncharacterized protein LOC126569187 isoform X2 [Anopheles aquasalis]|nr:uncharacterized protein LOC126569187 isoform X2 [Anopheles aquasalis]XP_050082070.1 uncharacterized protein LOC126569187 isoform X2 [Anopheles aquasalis]
MKIHSYSTSRPQEKVLTRSAATTSQTQEVNGTPESKKKQQQDTVPVTIRTSARQQLRKESKAAAAAAAASSSSSTVQPSSSSTPARSSAQERKNISSVKRSTVVEAGSGAAKRSRRQPQQQQSAERETEANRQGKRESSVESQEEPVTAESLEQKKQQATPTKQRTEGGASVSLTPLSKSDSTPSKGSQSKEVLLLSPAASSSTETAPEITGRRPAVANGLDIEDELAYFHLPKGSHAIVKQGNIVISTRKRQEADSEDDDGGASSSTASAVEDICDMDSTHSSSRLSHAGTPINRTFRNVKLAKIGTETVVDAGTTTILMSEEDYHQHQLQQQQQQRQEEEQSIMEEYETGVLVTEDMEDTDGGGGGGASGGLLSGNRLYRKKVKRKVIGRPLGSSSTAAANVSNVAGIGSISSTKAKLQMVHEFPTLFLGLRRNRMFLINSLAQCFDLNQRDIILTLRKIKLNESSARLAVIFGLGVNEVDLLIHKNVPKIADCLRNFILWPDDFTMKLNVPIKLRQHFSRIHLILNYLVLRVNQNVVRSLSLLANIDSAASYCPTEQCHKLKFLIASTLDGCVCFISRAFGIQTDDEQVLSQSGFLTKFKTNTNLIAGQNFHHFEDRLANGHDHANNNGGRNHDDDDDEHGATEEEPFEDIVSEKISKSRTFKLKNYIENILENFQNHQILHPQTCIDCRTFPLLDDIVVIVGALINLQKQEID